MLSRSLVDYAIEKVLGMRVARATKIPRIRKCKVCGSKMFVRRSGALNYCSNKHCSTNIKMRQAA